MALNKKLLKDTMNQIIKHPETWNQNDWHCGTQHCFAGWAQLLACGGDPDNFWDAENHTSEVAKRELGISEAIADYLFDGERDMPELYAITLALLKGKLGAGSTSYDKIERIGSRLGLPIIEEDY